MEQKFDCYAFMFMPQNFDGKYPQVLAYWSKEYIDKYTKPKPVNNEYRDN